MKRAACNATVLTLLLLSAAPAAEPERRGAYLLHLPGIGGLRQIDRNLVAGLVAGGVDADARIYDWTENDPGLASLVALERNRRQAKKIAGILEKRFREDPQRPIYLTAHSGGTGLAVWALENLPDDVHVHTLVLLASALSPTYDLSAALRHVSHKAYALNSAGDSFVLGTGTTTFGTIDGIKTNAAGLNGFEPRDMPEYAKLQQFTHNAAWMALGNDGTHIGPMSRRFARDALAPLITDGVPLPVTTSPTTRSAAAGPRAVSATTAPAMR